MSASHYYTDKRHESYLVGIKGCHEESLSTHGNCWQIHRTWQVIKCAGIQDSGSKKVFNHVLITLRKIYNVLKDDAFYGKENCTDSRTTLVSTIKASAHTFFEYVPNVRKRVRKLRKNNKKAIDRYHDQDELAIDTMWPNLFGTAFCLRETTRSYMDYNHNLVHTIERCDEQIQDDV